MSPTSDCLPGLPPAMVKPGGLLFVATINRTAKSFALAIVGAEYILRWLPRGTHQWDKFVTPEELEAGDRAERIASQRKDRRRLQPVRRSLAARSDIDVNYMMVAEKAA